MTVLAKGHFFLRIFGGWDPQGEPRSHFFFMKFPNAIHGCLVYLRYKKTAIVYGKCRQIYHTLSGPENITLRYWPYEWVTEDK